MTMIPTMAASATECQKTKRKIEPSLPTWLVAAVAMQMGATAETLAQTVHAHPTMPEGLMEAAEDVEGLAIHLARRKVG